VKLASGDYIDLKAYEPAMRYLIDKYIRADESEKISVFDDMSLIQLIVERGPEAVKKLPKGIQQSEGAVAETIENNVRKLIIDESPINPAYYEKMSKLLDALIAQRREGAVSYKDYLEKIAELTKQATMPGGAATAYPAALGTAAKRALYDNLGKNVDAALAVDAAVNYSRMDDWRSNAMKTKRVRWAIRDVIAASRQAVVPAAEPESGSTSELGLNLDLDTETDRVLELVKNQHEY
jgi:type I restriction enzyme R subunit